MAIWSEAQRRRLAAEEELLCEEIPNFYFQDHALAGLTTVRGDYTSTYNNRYSLCIRIKEDYPYEMPDLYVTEPWPLYGYGGRTIQSYGTSHTMHVWAPDWNNYVKICHTKSEYWTANDTLLGVLMKGFLWLEAFEVHRRIGKELDSLSLTYR